MPRTLEAEARKEWRRVVPLLEDAGLLTKADHAALVRYCEAWAEWVEVNERIKQTGVLIRRSRDDGELRRNPLLFVRRELADALDRLAVQLMLTPASRLRAGIDHGHHLEREDGDEEREIVDELSEMRRRLAREG
jgi:P27 family predicted phage terminase small subunit